MDVLFRALATATITIEHEYTSLLFSIDNLCHPLFRGLHAVLGPVEAGGDYALTKLEFTEKRLMILECTCRRLWAG